MGRRAARASGRVDDRVLTSFMTELDGLEARGNMLVVAATNRRESLDPALLRPGRLGDLVLEIPRPSWRRPAPFSSATCRRSCRTRATSRGRPPRRHRHGGVAALRAQRRRGVGDDGLPRRHPTRRSSRAIWSAAPCSPTSPARPSSARACARRRAAYRASAATTPWRPSAQELDRAVAALTPLNCHAHLPGLPQDLAVARVQTATARHAAPHRYSARRSGSHHADPEDPRRRRRAEQLHPGRVRRRRHRPDRLAPAPRRRPRRVGRRRRPPREAIDWGRCICRRTADAPTSTRTISSCACRNAQRVRPRGVLAGHAGMARDAMHARTRMPAGCRLQALANCSDGQGNSYGSHVSVLLTRAAWDDIR